MSVRENCICENKEHNNAEGERARERVLWMAYGIDACNPYQYTQFISCSKLFR